MFSGHSARPLCLRPSLSLLRSGLPTESFMNGTARPYENSTINTAILPSVYFFAQGMYLYLLRSGFSVGLHRAKITAVRAKEGLCLSRLRSSLPSEDSMKGAVRPCENPTINTAILLSDYALAQGMCLYLSQVGFLGRAAPRQDNGGLC